MNEPGNVILNPNIGEELQQFFEKHVFTKIAVLVDENTTKHCLSIVSPYLPSGFHLLEIASGEEEKNLDSCARIWGFLTDNSFDRKSLLVNLGGGVIGDMGGFCAATFKRGISFINIPTTLLAQVDASVGGKLGVDFFGFKNHIGVFQNPLRVFISSNFLRTLDRRELRSGFSEVIKHCLIADRNKFFEISSRELEEQDWDDVISHSVKIKEEVVANDPQENGLRKILNFGHTIGHAVETYFMNAGSRILHGEAIAIGMICEAWLAVQKCGMSESDLKAAFQYIQKVFEMRKIDESLFEEILQLTLQDKKNENDAIKASLLNKIGSCQFNVELSMEEMKDSLKAYNEMIIQIKN